MGQGASALLHERQSISGDPSAIFSAEGEGILRGRKTRCASIYAGDVVHFEKFQKLSLNTRGKTVGYLVASREKYIFMSVFILFMQTPAKKCPRLDLQSKQYDNVTIPHLPVQEVGIEQGKNWRWIKTKFDSHIGKNAGKLTFGEPTCPEDSSRMETNECFWNIRGRTLTVSVFGIPPYIRFPKYVLPYIFSIACWQLRLVHD